MARTSRRNRTLAGTSSATSSTSTATASPTSSTKANSIGSHTDLVPSPPLQRNAAKVLSSSSAVLPSPAKSSVRAAVIKSSAPAPAVKAPILSNRPTRKQEIMAKIEAGIWLDDWGHRAEHATLEDFAARQNGLRCKPRPTDSRKKSDKSPDERAVFIPWCNRKK